MSSEICRYFLRGTCRFGDYCRFRHIMIDEGEDRAQALPPIVASSTAAALNVRAKPFIPKMQQMQEQRGGSSGGGDAASYVNPTKTFAEVVGNRNYRTSEAFTLNSNLCYCDNAVCPMIHPDYCEICGERELNPENVAQRVRHVKDCKIKQERVEAVARSKDKICGICFEIIMEKPGREQRFGILPNCKHVFCLECIRKWRQAKQFENRITRACPECRISSDYVCPSAFWVETKEEKEKLLTDYKNALGEKDCKYFKKGKGKCPFGNKCFYKHALPNGTRVDVGVPKRQIRRLQRGDDEISELLDVIAFICTYIRRNFDGAYITTDSEESDWSYDEFEGF